MNVLVFGDSITQGYWDTDGGWVQRLRQHYNILQVNDLKGRNKVLVVNLGIPGDNSTSILKRVESETIARTFGSRLPVVVIQIGVNDSSNSMLSGDKGVGLPIDRYEKNLRDIIQKVKLISSKIILVGLSACDESLTNPVSWGDFHYTNKSIKNYEDKMKDVAFDEAVPFIPAFDNFMREIKTGKDLLPDGLHPNNEGHAILYEIILKKIDSLFGR